MSDDELIKLGPKISQQVGQAMPDRMATVEQNSSKLSFKIHSRISCINFIKNLVLCMDSNI